MAGSTGRADLSIEACSGGSAIAGEATRGDGQPGEHLMQAGAHIGNGELDRGDHVAAGPEHRHRNPAGVGLPLVPAHRHPRQPGDLQRPPQPRHRRDRVSGIRPQPSANTSPAPRQHRSPSHHRFHRARRRREAQDRTGLSITTRSSRHPGRWDRHDHHLPPEHHSVATHPRPRPTPHRPARQEWSLKVTQLRPDDMSLRPFIGWSPSCAPTAFGTAPQTVR